MKTMKRIYIGIGFLLSSSFALAQSESTAISMATQGQNRGGSARYQSLANSMGAVGAEFSAIATNPASLAFFRSDGKVSLTTSLGVYSPNVNWYDESMKNDKKYRFGLDELSYISSWKKTAGIGFAYAFGVNKVASFDRSFSASATMSGDGTSLPDYIAASINKIRGNRNPLPDKRLMPTENPYAYQEYPWLWTLAKDQNWILSDDGTGRLYHSNYRANGRDYYGASSALFNIKESGDIMKYNLSLAFDINKFMYLGIAMNMSSLTYHKETKYTENHLPSDKGIEEYLNLNNHIYTRGLGWDLGVGLIANIGNTLRLGLAAYTPTYYNLSTSFWANANSVVDGERLESGTPKDVNNRYIFRSPWRFSASGAYIFGYRGFINLDYEASIVGSTKLADDSENDNVYDIENEAISSDYGIGHSVRIGGEFNITNRFAIRGGFMYNTSPINSSQLKEQMPAIEYLTESISPSYTLPDGSYRYSLGLGYKITPNWSIDLSVINDISKYRTYTFAVITDPAPTFMEKPKPEAFLEGMKAIENKNNLISTALSISYRF